MSGDTIFALSSGAVPAAIAVVRISGPDAFAAARALAGSLPAERRAALRSLRDAQGILLDRALVLCFPRPATATGEDLVELHLHGGRAVVAAVERALAVRPGLRPALAGEFTRRALLNGRIALSQAEGLADLLAAETEQARRAALRTAEGGVARLVATWQRQLVGLSAQVEALIDYADEDDVPASADAVAALRQQIAAAAVALAALAARPPVERLRDGIRVVLAGPPNSGKSSVLNALAEREAAIATPIAGTTRDIIEVPVQHDGIAWTLVDTAGLRIDSDDPIERIGIDRAQAAIAAGDIVLWLGDAPPPSPAIIALHARCDAPGRGDPHGRPAVSVHRPATVAALWALLAGQAARLLPLPDEQALNRRQLARLAAAARSLATVPDDLILIAEHLRHARRALNEVDGTGDVEAVLDDIFARFCIGK